MEKSLTKNSNVNVKELCKRFDGCIQDNNQFYNDNINDDNPFVNEHQNSKQNQIDYGQNEYGNFSGFVKLIKFFFII